MGRPSRAWPWAGADGLFTAGLLWRVKPSSPRLSRGPGALVSRRRSDGVRRRTGWHVRSRGHEAGSGATPTDDSATRRDRRKLLSGRGAPSADPVEGFDPGHRVVLVHEGAVVVGISVDVVLGARGARLGYVAGAIRLDVVDSRPTVKVGRRALPVDDR